MYNFSINNIFSFPVNKDLKRKKINQDKTKKSYKHLIWKLTNTQKILINISKVLKYKTELRNSAYFAEALRQ